MMNHPAKVPTMTAALLLLTMHMALIFSCVWTGRSRWIRRLYILHFLVTFLAVYLTMIDYKLLLDYPEKKDAMSLADRIFSSLPALLIWIYEGATAVIIAIGFWELRRFSKNHLTEECIKETMDLFPAGIAFAKADGTVVFSNLAMNALSRRLTGKGIADLDAFRKAVAWKAGHAALSGTKAEISDGSRTWLLSSEALNVEGEPYEELTAADITAQAAISKELKEKNRKLRDLHMRLEICNKQADRIVIGQELLTARMAVHTEVGNVLLECRRYLKDPDSFDETVLLQALKNENTYLLREFEQDDTARDPLADALEMADTIGVDVTIAGLPPAEGAGRAILSSAIIECATNAVKHADGDQLSVEIRGAGVFFLQSNGRPPKEEIRERGGLLSLRTLVEKEGGTMELKHAPAFQMTITLPI